MLKNAANSNLLLSLDAREERFALAEAFIIARGAKTEAVGVTVTLNDNDGHSGRGECTPYARYDDTPASVLATIEKLRPGLETGAINRITLQNVLPPGAARNALDCAFWDLEAKQAGARVATLAKLAAPKAYLVTASTISLDTPAAMEKAALKLQGAKQVKVKLGRTDGLDLDRMKAVREALPKCRLLVDLNEGWTIRELDMYAPAFADMKIACLEQPLAANEDRVLEKTQWPLPIIADESCHGAEDLDRIVGRYQGINIKLDKTGGLTEAMRLRTIALSNDLKIMIGCMVCSSLGIAPALLLCEDAAFVDLDGAALLAKDREHALVYKNNQVFPASAELWG